MIIYYGAKINTIKCRFNLRITEMRTGQDTRHINKESTGKRVKIEAHSMLLN